jgi:hypothetical protein
MSQLSNSDRHVLKATHTPLKLDGAEQGKLGRAVEKAAYIRALKLQTNEAVLLQRVALATGSSAIADPVWDILKQFEPQAIALLSPKPSLLAEVPSEQLLAFGHLLIESRKQVLSLAQTPPTDPAVGLPNFEPAPSAPDNALGKAAASVQFGVSAINAFRSAIAISPIGMLHLERIESAPAGIERGELLATIPLAPKETTSVVQKEWTVTSEEFSSIVTDSLENVSENGVTEKTELAEATESQSKHSQQLGLNASVSGSYGFVTFATSASFSDQSIEENSRKESRKHAAEVTEKASSRVRKERKVTIETTSVRGNENTTTRTLTNPSETDAMRIDYFSMMRRWRVRLLRYGLRMTYDIAIPEPGGTLRQMHARLADLETRLSGSFSFELDPAILNEQNFQAIASKFGMAVQGPPPATWQATKNQGLIHSYDGSQYQTVDFNVPEAFEVQDVEIGGSARQVQNGNPAYLTVFPGDITITNGVASDNNSSPFNATHMASFNGRTGAVSIGFVHGYVVNGMMYATLSARRTDAAFKAWQQEAWLAIFNAARDAYYTGVQALTQERDALRARIAAVDTLTLRREEREEIMKGALRWLLGSGFEFMMPEIIQLFFTSAKEFNAKLPPTQRLTDAQIEMQLSQGIGFSGNKLGVDANAWSTMMAYQEMVKFLHQAIEWDNLLYLTYPYFWDVPLAWDFVRILQHPDATREQFIRAGSARVVLTIRPGYEGDFAAFVDRGDLSVVLNGDHPYLTIGNEMQRRAQANYPGIPPANPEPAPRPLLTPGQRKAWSAIELLVAQLELYKSQNGRYPTTSEGLAALPPNLPSTDPWGHAYVYRSPGAFKDYELSSLGLDGKPGGEGEDADITSWADASLIAEWFEYTPTHGTDIQVSSNLSLIA